MTSFLHIHGQEDNHHPAHIIGTRDELLKLKIAIEKAMYFPWQSEAFVIDGEGYYVNIIALDDATYEGKDVPLPYFHQMGSEYLPPKDYSKQWSLYSLWKRIRAYYGMQP
jgi:hypothetical protein